MRGITDITYQTSLLPASVSNPFNFTAKKLQDTITSLSNGSRKGDERTCRHTHIWAAGAAAGASAQPAAAAAAAAAAPGRRKRSRVLKMAPGRSFGHKKGC